MEESHPHPRTLSHSSLLSVLSNLEERFELRLESFGPPEGSPPKSGRRQVLVRDHQALQEAEGGVALLPLPRAPLPLARAPRLGVLRGVGHLLLGGGQPGLEHRAQALGVRERRP